MEVFTQYPNKRKISFIDVVIIAAVFVLLYSLLKLGSGMTVSFLPSTAIDIDLSPSALPYYAGRSLLRMFIAFFCSLLFTFIYGYAAAKIKAAGTVLIPILDILQSIPVLGFLSATITAFMAAFPGSLMGVECASIFAIFTGQAWNMTFSFYHSLLTIPKDLEEASKILHFNPWRKFISVELPASAISLIWNSMMSFGGGWFFLAASEAISVLGNDIHLPGIGSYLAAAVDDGNMQAMFYAMITMLIMIILVDVLFWRPLVVWSQRFKMELSTSGEQPESIVYNILYRSFVVHFVCSRIISPAAILVNQGILNIFDKFHSYLGSETKKDTKNFVLKIFGAAVLIYFVYELYFPAKEAVLMIWQMGLYNIYQVVLFGLYTGGRVLVALLVGAVWTIPAGVKIGLNPKLSARLQPIVQIAASFPANMLFPFFTILFIKYQFNFSYASILLMMLGTQWYILFNVIAGTMSIPNDLLEASEVFSLTGWDKWRKLILPAIFPHLVTGLITASGGAWNASIISELVTWEDFTLTAPGIGSYISAATDAGSWDEILVGLTVMCILVVLVNRLLWHRLYELAHTKYHLD